MSPEWDAFHDRSSTFPLFFFFWRKGGPQSKSVGMTTLFRKMKFFVYFDRGILLESVVGWGYVAPRMRSLRKIRANLYRRTPPDRIITLSLPRWVSTKPSISQPFFCKVRSPRWFKWLTSNSTCVLSPGLEPQVGRTFDFICKNKN